jgi:hypothetical protein
MIAEAIPSSRLIAQLRQSIRKSSDRDHLCNIKWSIARRVEVPPKALRKTIQERATGDKNICEVWNFIGFAA